MGNDHAKWERIFWRLLGFFSNTDSGFKNMLIPRKQTKAKSGNTMAAELHEKLHSKQG